MAAVMTCLMAVGTSGLDWPYWRGPEQTGLSREAAPVRSWSLEGENLVWKVPVGGRTTPVVMGGRVFFIAPVGEGVMTQERVVCLDGETGGMLWEHRFNVFHSDVVANRVGWTALVGDPETGNVYAHGTGGEMICFNRNGKVLWNRSMTEEFGRISGYGGRLHTPIIDENRVIVSFLNSNWGSDSRPSHRYVAFDKDSGEVLWWAAPGAGPLDTTYACPAVAVIGGVRQLVAPNADGNVYGMKARTGETLWTFKLSKRGLNVSPVVDGDYVYVGHSEENLDNTDMGRVVCIDATKRGDITETGEVWRLREFTAGYVSPAIANGRLYIADNSANLVALEAGSGKKVWEFSLGRVGKGSAVVTADGVIYVGEQNGVFHILKDEGDRCVSLDVQEFRREDNLVDEVFGSPAVADGRVYFITRYNTYCLGSKEASRSPAEVPPMPTEKGGDGEKATFCRIEPGEITVSPGESVRFRAVATDAHARAFRPLRDVTWSVVGVPGTISAAGELTASGENDYSAGLVTVKGEGLEARARVRVIPSLDRGPIRETFDDMEEGKVPPGWLGVNVKTKIEERDGSRVLRKLASKDRPSPPFMRLEAYATPPLAGGYTVQCDMLGTPKKRFKADMGLVNSRYRMYLGGRDFLRVESWSALPRFREDEPFTWETDRWYTVKFEVRLEGEKGVVRGKVWPRDSAEPDGWTIEAEDPCPNRAGSAGLYAYSTMTTPKSDGPEVYFDNFQVTRND